MHFCMNICLALKVSILDFNLKYYNRIFLEKGTRVQRRRLNKTKQTEQLWMDGGNFMIELWGAENLWDEAELRINQICAVN